MDWALMAVSLEEYRERLLQQDPGEDPDLFIAEMVEKKLLFKIPFEDGTAGLIYTQDLHEKLEKLETRAKQKAPARASALKILGQEGDP